MATEEELLKLASFIVTDGGIFKKRNLVFFDSVDDAMINHFVKTLRNLNIHNFFITKGHGTKEVCFTSKKITEKLLNLIGESKTIPFEIIKDLSEKDISGILRILFSCDGGASLSISKCKTDGKVRIHRKIIFTSKKNFENLLTIQKLLKILGITSRIQGSDLEIKGFSNILKFRQLIGFLDKIKVTKKSKKWKGLEKNLLLQIVLESFRGHTQGISER